MRRLANTVGVSATAIYHYFESKEAMLWKLRIRVAEKLNDRIRAIDSRLSPHEYLGELGMHYLGFALENPNLYRLLFESPFADHLKAEDHPVLYFTYLAARGALEKAVTDVASALGAPAGGAAHAASAPGTPAGGAAAPGAPAQGAPARPDPRHEAMMGWMMLHGFCSLMISGMLPPAEGMTRESLKDLFMHYYAGGGPKHRADGNNRKKNSCQRVDKIS